MVSTGHMTQAIASKDRKWSRSGFCPTRTTPPCYNDYNTKQPPRLSLYTNSRFHQVSQYDLRACQDGVISSASRAISRIFNQFIKFSTIHNKNTPTHYMRVNTALLLSLTLQRTCTWQRISYFFYTHVT